MRIQDYNLAELRFAYCYHAYLHAALIAAAPFHRSRALTNPSSLTWSRLRNPHP